MPRLYSHPVVHPHPVVVVAAPPAQWQGHGQQAPAPEAVQGEGVNGDGNAPPGVIMRNPGKRCRPGMRLAQAAFAATALAVMASTHGFASVTAFRCVLSSCSLALASLLLSCSPISFNFVSQPICSSVYLLGFSYTNISGVILHCVGYVCAFGSLH